MSEVQGSNSPDTEYSIRDASMRLGVPVQKLRRWDAQGVLVARRTDGGHRRYSREMIESLMRATPKAAPAVEEKPAIAKKILQDKRNVTQLLIESENRFRDLVETSHDLIWTTDAQGRFTYLSNATADIFGLAAQQLLGRNIFDFESKFSRFSNRRYLAVLCKSGEVKDYVARVISSDGTDRWVGTNARVTRDESGRIAGVRGTARNVTAEQEAARTIEFLATHDSLTNLPNRVSLQRTLEQALAAGDVGAVLFIDIDHFKYVNDNFGHRAGDHLIAGVSGVLKEAAKDHGGQVFRLGGDEYAVHLPEVLRSQAVRAADHVLESLRHYRFLALGQHRMSSVTASIGIALYPLHGVEVATLLTSADLAMYQAKDSGRNRHFLYDHDARSLRQTHNRAQWSSQLRHVLDDDRISLYYQPVVRLSDLRAVHCEILLRIHDEEGGIVLPSQFIEHAESLGLVQEFDMRVVERMLEYLGQCAARGPKWRYFVNLSRTSISDPQWVRKFHRMLKASSADLSQLVFEITETAAMHDVDVTEQFIRELKSMGCRFALDDFGAGFSSFYYLKRFDVDYLKIDGGFVRDLATDEANRIFVRALCDVAEGLNKQVIAEWVETQDVMNILKEMGTPFGQGYYFKTPAPLWENMPKKSPSPGTEASPRSYPPGIPPPAR